MDAVTVTMRIEAISNTLETYYEEADDGAGHKKLDKRETTATRVQLKPMDGEEYMPRKSHFEQPHTSNIYLVLPNTVDVSGLKIGGEVEVRISPRAPALQI
jgi:hypothetical protein